MAVINTNISAIKAAGEPSFGNTPATARLDLTRVTSAFTIVDFFAKGFREMLEGNVEDYIKNFDRFMKS